MLKLACWSIWEFFPPQLFQTLKNGLPPFEKSDQIFLESFSRYFFEVFGSSAFSHIASTQSRCSPANSTWMPQIKRHLFYFRLSTPEVIHWEANNSYCISKIDLCPQSFTPVAPCNPFHLSEIRKQKLDPILQVAISLRLLNPCCLHRFCKWLLSNYPGLQSRFFRRMLEWTILCDAGACTQPI